MVSNVVDGVTRQELATNIDGCKSDNTIKEKSNNVVDQNGGKWHCTKKVVLLIKNCLKIRLLNVHFVIDS